MHRVLEYLFVCCNASTTEIPVCVFVCRLVTDVFGPPRALHHAASNVTTRRETLPYIISSFIFPHALTQTNLHILNIESIT